MCKQTLTWIIQQLKYWNSFKLWRCNSSNFKLSIIKEQRTVKHPAVCNSLSTYSPTFLIMNVYPTELEGKTTELSYPFFTDSVLSKEKKNEYITHKTQSLLIHVCTVQISEHKLKMEVTNAIYSTTLKWRVSSLLTELELQVPPKVTFGTYRFSLLNVYSYKGSNYSKRTNLSFCLPTARTQLLVFQTHPIIHP